MKHVATIYSGQKDTAASACGQCATSCQSACKTSCTVGNQVCVNKG
jgi:predicted ribosomally synthesized six-cysteine peptide SCIFF